MTDQTVVVDDEAVSAPPTEAPETPAEDATPAPEDVTTDEPAEAEAAATEGDEPELDLTESGEGEAEAEEHVFNFGGNEFRVAKGELPQEVADRVQEFGKNIYADYTRKSQDVAEQRKTLEARETAIGRIQQLSDEAMNLYAEGLQLKSRLAQLQQIDTATLWRSDPDKARQVSDEVAAVTAALNQKVQAVNEHEQQVKNAQSKERDRLVEAGKAVINKAVKNFETAELPGVIDYAVETLGMDRATAEADWALNPQITLAVHKAMKYDRALAKAQKAKTKQVQPGTRPKGAGTARAKPDDMKLSPEAWALKRNRELAEKRRKSMGA